MKIEYNYKPLIGMIIGLAIVFTISYKFSTRDQMRKREAITNEENSTASSAEIYCLHCGKNLTDDNNRFNPNGTDKGYYCASCYQDLLHSITPPPSTQYETGADGRVYESTPCSLCGGTGIEANNSKLSRELGEGDGRVCPQCNGKGVVSY